MKKDDVDKLYVEGNAGGDYLKMTPVGDNLVRVKVGHCCVVTVNHVVPVELITHTLTELFLEHELDGFRHWLPWGEGEVSDELRNQISCVVYR